jgi:hypothetical protein
MSLSPNPQTLKIIAAWLAKIATLCNPPQGETTDDLRNRIVAYTGELGLEFPSAAFTPDSVRHVVQDQAWFPAYATIRSRLAEWWRDHKPACAPALADYSPKPPRWQPMDEHWLDFWHTRAAEIAALPDPNEQRAARANLASLICAQSPRAWSVVSNTPLAQHNTPSAAEIGRVAAMLRPAPPPRPYQAPQAACGLPALVSRPVDPAIIQAGRARIIEAEFEEVA